MGGWRVAKPTITPDFTPYTPPIPDSTPHKRVWIAKPREHGCPWETTEDRAKGWSRVHRSASREGNNCSSVAQQGKGPRNEILAFLGTLDSAKGRFNVSGCLTGSFVHYEAVGFGQRARISHCRCLMSLGRSWAKSSGGLDWTRK